MTGTRFSHRPAIEFLDLPTLSVDYWYPRTRLVMSTVGNDR